MNTSDDQKFESIQKLIRLKEDLVFQKACELLNSTKYPGLKRPELKKINSILCPEMRNELERGFADLEKINSYKNYIHKLNETFTNVFKVGK